ncbi:hypothetical protein [Clavibacter sp. CT19]|uniref:hypothetical protein n=1 Tax=unclassified Clavibacter TaxID=2626594 RepID=UPI0022EA32E2|nr:hypothetical protein [Clavibacter sp. CT19]
MSKWNGPKAALAIVAAIAMFSAGSVPAHAEERFDAFSVVDGRGVLGHADEQFHGVGVQRQAGTVAASAEPVAIVPKMNGLSAPSVMDGDTKAFDADDFGVVVGANTRGTAAAFIAIGDAAAPQDFAFQIGGRGDRLIIQPDGGVAVTDASGRFLNFLEAPWARDASGRSLKTSYSISGNVLIQHVETGDAMFPVVADPSTGCGIGYCSIYFNHSETHDLATAGIIALGGATGACGLAGPEAIAACGIAAAAIGATAVYADNHNQCVGFLFSNFGTFNPFVYDGEQCN